MTSFPRTHCSVFFFLRCLCGCITCFSDGKVTRTNYSYTIFPYLPIYFPSVRLRFTNVFGKKKPRVPRVPRHLSPMFGRPQTRGSLSSLAPLDFWAVVGTLNHGKPIYQTKKLQFLKGMNKPPNNFVYANAYRYVYLHTCTQFNVRIYILYIFLLCV